MQFWCQSQLDLTVLPAVLTSSLWSHCTGTGHCVCVCVRLWDCEGMYMCKHAHM